MKDKEECDCKKYFDCIEEKDLVDALEEGRVSPFVYEVSYFIKKWKKF